MSTLEKELKKDYEADRNEFPSSDVASTPRMLPSPASITSSASSTPNHGCSTPSQAPSAPVSERSKYIPKRYWEPIFGPRAPPARSDNVTAPLRPMQVINLSDATSWHSAAKECAKEAEKSLSLPVLYKSFPRTFARMIQSSLQPGDEMQPDMDDDEGELYWPGQLATGDGLGWVCLMGRAMVTEFGKDYGYVGVNGVVQTPRVKELAKELEKQLKA
jgi:hypothetical protein